MKKLFITLILLGVIGLIYKNSDQIIRYITYNVMYRDDVLIHEDNEYARVDNYAYISQNDDFFVSNQQDMLDLIYTALNGGWDELIFYCDEGYTDCIEDFEEIDDNKEIENINNYVSALNKYSHIYMLYNQIGRIKIDFVYKYNDDNKYSIDTKLDEIVSNYTLDSMTDREKVKALHDYIINTTVYDIDAYNSTNEEDRDYPSTVFAVLQSHIALCNGYSETMALFLDKLNIPNYQIMSETHSWNFLYLDGSWYHLDVTWDDPITDNGSNVLTNDFFLITTSELENMNVESHDYDKTIYIEAQ